MSIIQEALKKPKNASDPTLDNGEAASPKEKKTFLGKRLRNKSIALFFYALSGAFFVIYMFTLFLTPAVPGSGTGHSAKPGSGAKRPAPVVRPLTGKAPVQAPASAKGFITRSRFPDFVLNGIMQLVDSPRAIVNNVIVGIGDAIGGATVEKINKDNVVLKTSESEITLKMR